MKHKTETKDLKLANDQKQVWHRPIAKKMDIRRTYKGGSSATDTVPNKTP